MAKNPVLNIGIVGVNDDTNVCINILRKLKRYALSGIFDRRQGQRQGEGKENGNVVHYFSGWKELVDKSDALLLTDGGEELYDICKYAVKNAKDVFVVHPFKIEADQLSGLLDYAEEAGAVVQFHSGFTPVLLPGDILRQLPFPVLIKSFQQYSEPEKNGYNLDKELFARLQWIQYAIQSKPKNIDGNQFTYQNPNAYLTDIRVEYENASVATVFFDSVSGENENKIMIFSRDIILTADMNTSVLTVESFIKPDEWLREIPENLKFIKTGNNSWKAKLQAVRETHETVMEKELKSFYDSIVFGKKVAMDLSSVFQTNRILDSIVKY